MKKNNKLTSLAITGAQIATSALPNPIGAIFSTLLGDLKDNIYQRRLEKWQSIIVERINKIDNDIEGLVNSEQFATAILKTSQLAVQTQSDEKMKVLSNALFNSYWSNIEEDKMTIFLHLVDKYTCTHIRVLKFLHDEYNGRLYGTVLHATVMVTIKMGLNDLDSSYLKKILNDLQNDYLVERFNENAQANLFSSGKDLVTKLGNEFYNFIRDTKLH